MHKPTVKLTYMERSRLSNHALSKRLLALMDTKQTNLSVAADVTKASQLIELADQVGPHICVFKTHIDILEDFTPDVSKKLRELADKHQFVLFEDRKFADIGNTVLQQYAGGLYKISDWSHITNAHPLLGPGLIEGLQKIGLPKGNGLLLLAQLSSKGNLINDDYAKKAVEMAHQYLDFVMGFICQEALSDHPALIHMTPGIQLGTKGDALGQQYHTPHHAIFEKGSDVIIVGRGIIQHPHPHQAAVEYRQASWKAYQQRLRTG